MISPLSYVPCWWPALPNFTSPLSHISLAVSGLGARLSSSVLKRRYTSLQNEWMTGWLTDWLIYLFHFPRYTFRLPLPFLGIPLSLWNLLFSLCQPTLIDISKKIEAINQRPPQKFWHFDRETRRQTDSDIDTQTEKGSKANTLISNSENDKRRKQELLKYTYPCVRVFVCARVCVGLYVCVGVCVGLCVGGCRWVWWYAYLHDSFILRMYE